ncbi:MAG TPA: MBL fold metallo-hydrolase [Ktedonobacteraceae bacterium]|jgi:hydroxyacylglutathione hydrolase|nr:MBL fold metallo-hydrolase [Ktedonobacteraceae bacterium]
MKIEQFFLEGLGHQSYFIAEEKSGVAAVVDPRRDVDVYLEAASRANMPISYVLETHVHNDYVSGGRELAAKTGAKIIAGEIDPLVYADRSVREGDAIALGKARFQVLHTPGHTPEHVSYLLFEPGNETPSSLFSGGSMLVGNAGRTDLLGPAHTLTLTKQQYATLRRLLDTLPGQVRVYPTHGAGSFCMSTTASPARTTTIAQERLTSPAALAKDEEDFIRRQMAGYIAYPTYYKYMHDANKYGHPVLGSLPVPPALSIPTVREQLAQGMPLIDGRAREKFAREHIPGSLNIELDSQFSTYIGWLLPYNTPLMILVEDEEGRREAVVQLIRIGWDDIHGFVDGGISSWKAAALPTEQFEMIDVDTLYKRWSQRTNLTVIDVRRDDEWKEGHIPDALHLHIGDLPQHLDEVPRNQPVAVICRTGHRAEMAASIIVATGREVIVVGGGGVPDWAERGYPITTEDITPHAAHHEHATHAHP